MADVEPRRGREHNAKATREAILNAAEQVFAEHGYDGARLEMIAQASSYNKSLIGQYFGDKLGLYSQVLKRADSELHALIAAGITPLMEDESIAGDAQKLKGFVAALAQTTFDYLVQHPRFLRILTWEMADGWQTYQQVISRLAANLENPFDALFAKARQAGLLRSDFPPVIQVTLVMQTCLSYIAFLPLYQSELPGEPVATEAALSQARDHLAAWLVAAMVVGCDLHQKQRESQTGGNV